jgi:hypothetical protein
LGLRKVDEIFGSRTPRGVQEYFVYIRANKTFEFEFEFIV